MPLIDPFVARFKEMSRPNRFICSGFGIGGDLFFHAKGAMLPETAVGPMDVPYQGRQIKMDGDRVYSDFTMTIYGGIALKLRKDFEDWNNHYNSPRFNAGYTDKRDGYVRLLSRQNLPVITFKITGAVLTNIAAVDLAWDTNDTPLEFTVTMAYDYHEITSGGVI